MREVMQGLQIKKGPYSQYGDGYNYTLVYQGEDITSHFCSGDTFAHADLFRHPATNELVGEMDYFDFKQIPIVNADNVQV